MPKKKLNWFLINENYGANLCPFAFHFDADYHGFKKAYGRGMNYQGVGTENGFLRQTYVLEDYVSFAKFIFKKLSTDRKFARRVLKKIYTAIDAIYTLDKRILAQDLKKMSDVQLAGLFDQFYKRYFTVSTWSVPFSFSEYRTLLWTNALTIYLQSRKIPKQYTALEMYQLLTSHSKKTFTARERESILKLGVEVRRSKKLLQLFKLPVKTLATRLQKENKSFFQKIINHTRRYAWINFGFEGPLLDIHYFLTAIKENALEKNPQKELQETERFFKSLHKQQGRLLKMLHLDAQHRWMFWVVREFGFQKAYRKDIEYFGNYVYDILLKEFGRRYNITVKQGHYLLKNEIVSILKGKKKVTEHQLNQRIQCNFYVVIRGKASLLVGKKAKSFIKEIKSFPVPKGIQELTGQCASRGHAKGAVRVIKGKSDYGSFKTGDILVSWATNPNMIPLMKRAAAIITDEGGVTCHAAIVSRELGIPCIIGTRFATKILKNGQKVEMNATKGIVRKI
ncbi:PEP-utilizing enzyme [Patescibacteria group bacterium]